MDLSFVIPARQEKYLGETINNILSNIRGDSEVLVALDGWEPEIPLGIEDKRVRFFKFETPIGQRAAINYLVKQSEAKYIFKIDAHCAIDEGMDVKLIEDMEPSWTVVPRMYNLDVTTWTPKWHKCTDYMYISSPTAEKPFRPQYFEGKAKDDWRRQPKSDKLIDDTMCCMGCGWFLERDRFWKQGGCDEGHVGGWGQQSIEVSLKAVLSGGALKVNKKTWFAHWFRGDVGFPYQISGKQIEEVRKYSRDLWLNDKWSLAERKLQWVIDKFDPPGWKRGTMDEETKKINEVLYKQIHRRKNYPEWHGVPILKMPTDLMLYSKVIWETKPELIIEIGTKFGGSALYLQDNLNLLGNGGMVVTVDINPQVTVKDNRITYLIGDSTSPEIIKQLKEFAKNKRTMVILDGDHSRVKVKWELHYYSDLVSQGCYLVLEDCYAKEGKLYGPGEARDWFLKKTKKFIQTDLDKRFLVGMNVGGWLLRK